MKKNIVFFMISLWIFFAAFSSSAHASGSRVADYLVQLGKMSYEKGNVEEAVHEFQKALILNPHHSLALEYLNALGQMRRTADPQATVDTKIDQLSRKAEIYREMLDYSQEQCAEIISQLKQSTLARQDVLQDNPPEYKKTAEIPDTFQPLSADFDQARQNPLVVIEHHSYDQVPDVRQTEWAAPAVEDKVSYVSGQMDQAQTDQRDLELLEIALERENELLALSRDNRDLRQKAEQQESALQNALEVMEDYLYLRQARMKDLGNQALIANLERLEKHQQLLDRTAALNDSNLILGDVIRKADEQEAMIRQKNLQIDDLQKRLEWYQKSFEAPANPQL